jgi:hypothetical protein
VGSEGERRKGEGKLGGGEVCSMALGGDRRPCQHLLDQCAIPLLPMQNSLHQYKTKHVLGKVFIGKL